jgi:hypothetical protein
MGNEEKINVQGTMRKMEVGEVLELEKKKYIPSSIRYTASKLKGDFGILYSVSVNENFIKIIRNN